NASSTVMFTDAAILNIDGNGNTVVIEYSFCEPPYVQSGSDYAPGLASWNPTPPLYQMSPSIAFRHDGVANVTWADGHVNNHTLVFSNSVTTFNGTVPQATVQAMGFGWWGPMDNSLFQAQ